MKFIQHYSSSRANLYEVVGSLGHRLLLECGVRWQLLEKALNFNLRNIEGCLLTHEHKDHSKAVRDAMKAGIRVFASDGTLKAIGEDVYANRKAQAVYDATIQQVGHFIVFPFGIIHDAAEPFGYIVHESDEWLLFCPDSGFIKQRFNVKFNIIAIECSYDQKILSARVDASDINEQVAKRIIKNHTEERTAIDYLERYCDLSKCREIHLLHCSGVNLDKKKTKQEFEKRFLRETIINGL